MATTTLALDVRQIETLQRAIQQYSGDAERTVNDVLHNEGGKLIQDEIMRLLPESGRTWEGKRTAAKHAKPFTLKKENLAVTVRTVSAYHYLYFPDDGTNTKNHVGYKGKPRGFMYKGAENQTNKIIDRCIDRLIKKWESD